jgi:hypothetical protein
MHFSYTLGMSNQIVCTLLLLFGCDQAHQRDDPFVSISHHADVGARKRLLDPPTDSLDQCQLHFHWPARPSAKPVRRRRGRKDGLRLVGKLYGRLLRPIWPHAGLTARVRVDVSLYLHRRHLA